MLDGFGPSPCTDLRCLLAVAVICAASVSCGASTGLEAGFDASIRDAADASNFDAQDGTVIDAGSCPEQFVTVDWVVDGERGSSGCRDAQGIINPASRGRDPRCEPHLETNFWSGSGDEGLPLQELTRGLTAIAHNIPLVTGASGTIEAWSLRAGLPPCLERRVALNLLLETTETADYVSGSWHVLRGGGAREWVDFELRDVVLEDVGGHHLVLERVHYHVRLYDPLLGP